MADARDTARAKTYDGLNDTRFKSQPCRGPHKEKESTKQPPNEGKKHWKIFATDDEGDNILVEGNSSDR